MGSMLAVMLLGHELGAAEHAAGVGGLVGGDVDEDVDTDGLGGLEHVAGADHVGLVALFGVALEEGQVLQRGGVEDDVRLNGLHDLEHALGVADVGEDEVVAAEQALAVDAELHGVDAGLVAVEDADEGRVVAVHLAGQLGADRAAGAGDEDALALEELPDAVLVGVDRAAAEEVLLGDVRDVAELDGAVDDLAGAGDDLQVDVEGLAAAVEVEEHLRADAGDGDDEVGGARLGDHALEVRVGAEHAAAEHVEVALGGVVVEEADRVVLGLRVLHHQPHELVAAVAGAVDEGALALAAVAQALAVAAQGEAAAEHDAEGEGAADERGPTGAR